MMPPASRRRATACGIMGHLPRPAPGDSYLRRRDPRTRKVKVVPEMVYNIGSDRVFVAKHQLLEDDWRTYRSVLHSHQAYVRQMAPMDERFNAYERENYVARKILGLNRHPIELLVDNRAYVDGTPFFIYKNAVAHPPGYFYQRYRKGMRAEQRKALNKVRSPRGLPVTTFAGPEESVYHVSADVRRPGVCQPKTHHFDGGAVKIPSMKSRMFLYNEPSAVSQACVGMDFTLPLTKRALKKAWLNPVVDDHFNNAHDLQMLLSDRLPSPLGKDNESTDGFATYPLSATSLDKSPKDEEGYTDSDNKDLPNLYY